VRFIKLILTLLLIVVLFISVVFFARKQVVAYGINNYLLAHKAQLSCIDFNLTPSFDIVISKMCIHSPQANVEFENVRLQLQFSSALPIRSIHVEAMSIQGKAKLLEQNDAGNAENSVKHYLATIAQFTLPLPILIKKFIYLPFIQADNANKAVFYGQLAINKNNIKVSLKDIEQANVFSVNLSPEGQSFTAKLNADLAQVRQFLAIHQLTLPAKLDKNLIITGTFSTQLQWHKETLTATSQLKNAAIDSAIGIAKSDSFNINGMLSWQSTITASQALFTIDEQSVVNTNFSKQKLREFLVRKNIAAEVVAIIKDNPSNSLVIKPQGRMQIDFAKQQIFIANVELTSNNKEPPLQVTFTGISLTYEKNKILSFILKQSNYTAQAKLLISRLKNISKQAVNIVSTGKIVSTGTTAQHNLGWQIMLSPTTTLEFSTLALAKLAISPAQLNSTTTKGITHTASATSATSKYALSIKKIIINGQGTIHIDNQGRTELSLQLNSQAAQLKIANIAQIAQVELQADISGSLQDISITASIIVDKQPLANVKLNGVITEPQLEIFAKNLHLTELLTLKLNLPIELSLIDGSLNYHLSGQLTDTDNWLNNTARLDISIQDVSGEIEGTWLQELNWQQKFILSDGYIKSVSADKKPINNLTIAKVETAPLLTEFSAQTALSFNNKVFSVIATDIDAKILGGKVNVTQAHWPFDISRSVNVQLTSIDLEELLELDPKKGIIVTGKISGSLPIMLNDKQFTIDGGELHNVGNGIIKVANNPTVAQLKASDLQLKLAFDAMQNIHYHQLSSDVSMAHDGYMLFDTVIKGRNPDLDNDVNLNLNLSYDLLGLLKSLNISKHLEQSIIDNLQKN